MSQEVANFAANTVRVYSMQSRGTGAQNEKQLLWVEQNHHMQVAEIFPDLARNASTVIPAWMPVSSAMDGDLKSIHGSWIPAIPAGMTILENMAHAI